MIIAKTMSDFFPPLRTDQKQGESAPWIEDLKDSWVEACAEPPTCPEILKGMTPHEFTAWLRGVTFLDPTMSDYRWQNIRLVLAEVDMKGKNDAS